MGLVTLGEASAGSLCHHQQAPLKSAHFKGSLVKYQTLARERGWGGVGGGKGVAEKGMEG